MYVGLFYNIKFLWKIQLSSKKTKKYKKLLYLILLFTFLLVVTWEPVEFLIRTTPVTLPGDNNKIYSLRFEYWKILLQSLAGIVVLIGLYFTYQKIRVSDDTQLTERFTRAIDQLGNDKAAIRLGAIYALERIAKDSDRDTETVIEILSSYVKHNNRYVAIDNLTNNANDLKSNIDGDKETVALSSDEEHEKINLDSINQTTKISSGPESDKDIEDNDIKLRELQKSGKSTDDQDKETSRVEIQSILTVLGRSMRKSGKKIYLSNSDLSKTTFSKGDYEGTFLNDANLSDAVFVKAKLRGSNFNRAIIHSAFLLYTDISNSTLLNASFKGSVQMYIDYENSNLSLTNLENTILVLSFMRNCSLIRANLQSAVLMGSNLVGANLWRANLKNSNLLKSNLSFADLKETNLKGALLIEANLLNAKNLTHEQLAGSKSLYRAKLDKELLIQVKKNYPELLDEKTGKKLLKTYHENMRNNLTKILRTTPTGILFYDKTFLNNLPSSFRQQ